MSSKAEAVKNCHSGKVLRLPCAAVRLFRREDGAVTVEAVLWVPFFFVLLTLITDAALIFYGQARALQVAQDANRSFSTGAFTSTDDAEAFIQDSLEDISPNATAETVFNDGIVTTVISLPAGDLDAVGFFTAFNSFEMQVISQMVQEF